MLKHIAFSFSAVLAIVISYYLNRNHQFSVIVEMLIVLVVVLTWMLVCLLFDSVRKY